MINKAAPPAKAKEHANVPTKAPTNALTNEGNGETKKEETQDERVARILKEARETVERTGNTLDTLKAEQERNQAAIDNA